MFCANCGKKLEDHVKFCTNCGTVVETPEVKAAEPAPASNFVPAPEPVKAAAPTPKPKKCNPLLIVLPIVAVVVLLIGGIILGLVTGVLGSPKTKVTNAFAKSALAYQKASKEIALPISFASEKETAYSQSMAVRIDELPLAPELEGLGVQLDLRANLEGKELGMVLTPSYGSADILDAQILLQDAELFLAVPQLTGDRTYMVNTETLGARLFDMDLVDEEFSSFGFNTFELIQIIEESAKVDEDFEKELKNALKDFVKAIEANKVRKEKFEVNDNDLKCDVYQVIIPEDALKDLFETIEDLSRNTDPTELIIDLLAAIGMPDYLIDEAMSEMGSLDVSAEANDAIDTILDDLGDIELEVFLHKGYVAAVCYEGSIQDVDFEFTVELGGGKNYVDDLRVTFLVDDVEIVLESNGDHGCSNGIYTDTTTVEVSSDYSDTITLCSELSYDPGADSENFSWTIDADTLKLDLIGQLSSEENAVSLLLDEVNVWADGEYIIGMGMDVVMGEYEPISLNTHNAVEVLTLTEDELYTEVSLIEETAMQWAADLVENNPQLFELLQNMYF